METKKFLKQFPGPDDIHTQMVRWLADFLAEPLSKLFTNSLNTAVAITDWRLAMIRSIRKKGDQEDVSNYRPESLTSIMGKIFERIVKKVLLSFLSDARSISPHQHGFLPRRPCLSNLLVFEEAMTHKMGEGHTVDAIYLDFANSIASVNRQFILAKMKFFGLGDVIAR